MESVSDNTPLIVILGQTASGKSALSLELAERFQGEIIAADSRTVYKGMDIGTAKPSLADRQRVCHHLIDIVTPNEAFSVADFQRRSMEAIREIAKRNRLPFLVGGSGLYIDAVVYGFSFRSPADPLLRTRLQALSVTELQTMIEERHLPLPENSKNVRHLIRTLETKGEKPKNVGLRQNTLLLGLRKESDVIEQAIRRRVDAMIADGLVAEVESMARLYGWGAPALQAPGYKAFRLYLAGQVSLDEAKRQFVRNDMQYAKRQKTWFKRNTDINWISNSEEAVDLITTFLNK